MPYISDENMSNIAIAINISFSIIPFHDGWYGFTFIEFQNLFLIT